jgi:hypothetical protein
MRSEGESLVTYSEKVCKAFPLHAMKALGGEEV